MAAAAVEKPATFSRDASNSSTNSQLDTGNSQVAYRNITGVDSIRSAAAFTRVQLLRNFDFCTFGPVKVMNMTPRSIFTVILGTELRHYYNFKMINIC